MTLQAQVGLTQVQQAEQSGLELWIEDERVEMTDVPFAHKVETIDKELKFVNVHLMQILR